MTRRVGASAAPAFEDIGLFLLVGPPNQGPAEFTDEQGAAGWAAHGPRMMEEWTSRRYQPGSRPFGFWRYEIGAEPDAYEDQVVLLAERGELSRDEIAALDERQTWTDINDGSKHVDEKAVELWERVCEALE